MAPVEIKTFMLQKDGEPSTCRDRMALAPSRGLFAVADGVTRSYLPQVVAERACSLFVADPGPFTSWVERFEAEGLQQVAEAWNARATELLDALAATDPRRRDNVMRVRSRMPAGATTLAGICVDAASGSIGYHILGDSTLFVFDAAGTSMKALCTSPTEERDGRAGYVVYDNRPSCICPTSPRCEGTVDYGCKGEWRSGSLPLAPGYVVLATDGVSQWLQDEFLAHGIEAVRRLWELPDQAAFEALSAQVRADGAQFDDDLAVILLRIPADGADGTFVELVRGDLEFAGVPPRRPAEAAAPAAPAEPAQLPRWSYSRWIKALFRKGLNNG